MNSNEGKIFIYNTRVELKMKFCLPIHYSWKLWALFNFQLSRGCINKKCAFNRNIDVCCLKSVKDFFNWVVKFTTIISLFSSCLR